MPDLFRAVSLSHKFGDGKEGLKDINLKISDGEFIVVAGRNGSGKTLLVRHFVGLSVPTSGQIFFRGGEIQSGIKRLRMAVGFVFQDTDSQILGQTVAEDVAFGPSNLRLATIEIEERTEEALSLSKLAGMESRRPETLSGGEKRRLAIAGVLAMRPECLILDEPFANLDLESVRDVVQICRSLKELGKTLIVVTHELEKILPLADRLIILDKGGICFDDHPAKADPEDFMEHGLVCPYKGFFPWVYSRDELGPLPSQGF